MGSSQTIPSLKYIVLSSRSILREAAANNTKVGAHTQLPAGRYTGENHAWSEGRVKEETMPAVVVH